MDSIRFRSEEELTRYISNHVVKLLGHGREGCSFLIDNNLVLKRLYQSKDIESITMFSNIDIDSFIFPKSYIDINNKVYGIITDYKEGETLIKQVPNKQKINILGKQLDKLVNDIHSISDNKVKVKDFILSNILYDYNSFYIIDTTSYIKDNSSNLDYDNIKVIMYRVYEALLKEILCNNKYLKDLSYYNNIDYCNNPSNYLSLLKERIENISNRSINTLDDAKKILIKK